MRRKIWIALLYSVLIIQLLCAAIADSKDIIPFAGSDMNNAAEVQVGKLYYVNSDVLPQNYDISADAGWYKFTAQESGTYHFSLKPKNGSAGINIISPFGEYIGGSGYSFNHIGEEYENMLYSFNLDSSQTYYIHICSYGCDFTICSPSLHASLTDNEMRRMPTCTETGYAADRCKACGAEFNIQEIPATGHNPGLMNTVKLATCTIDGLAEQRCEVCNVLLASEVLPATSHVLGPWTVVQEATCSKDGKQVQYCIVCGEEFNAEVLPLFGHTSGVWQVTREASCIHSGLKEKKCTVCNETLESEILPALGHEYTEWETIKEATKQEEGERSRYCIRCGNTQSEVIPKKPKFLGLF